MSSVSGLSGGCSVSLSELLELFLLFDWIYGRRKEEVKAVRKEERMTMIKGSGMMEERRRGRKKVVVPILILTRQSLLPEWLHTQ